MNPFPPPLPLSELFSTSQDRRSFLKRTLLGTIGLHIASLLPEASGATKSLEAVEDPSGFFKPHEAKILGDISRAFIASDTGKMPDPVALGVVERIGNILNDAHPETQSQIRLLLILFNRLPCIFSGTLQTFTEMNPQAQRTYLAQWGESRLMFRRMAYQALKNLIMLVYYSRDEVWPLIGYSGPWV